MVAGLDVEVGTVDRNIYGRAHFPKTLCGVETLDLALPFHSDRLSITVRWRAERRVILRHGVRRSALIERHTGQRAPHTGSTDGGLSAMTAALGCGTQSYRNAIGGNGTPLA